MAKIGSLVADMRLQSAAFTRGLAGAKRDVGSQTAQMRKSMRSLSRATRNVGNQFSKLRAGVAGLAGALAVRQFVSFGKAALANADSIAKQSRQLQISAAALQRYTIEGEIAGVATAKLETGIGAFVKRVGELRAGTGTLVTILDKSNVALKNQLLAATSTEEGLRIMLRAISESGSAFDKQALSAAGFGRQAGQAMVLLADSIGTLDVEMVKLVTRSGAVLSAGEKLTDEFTLLQSAFSAGFDTGVITDLNGSVVSVKDSMIELRRTGEALGRAVGASLRGVAAAATLVADNIRPIGIAIAALAAFKAASIITGIAVAFVKFALAARAAAAGVALFNAFSSKMMKGIVGVAAAAATVAAFVLASKKIAPGIKDAVDGLTELGDGGNAAAGGVGAMTNAIQKSTAEFQTQIANTESLIAALGRSRKAYDTMAVAIAIQTAAARLGAEPNTKLGEAWVTSAVHAANLERELAGLIKAQDEMATSAKQIFEQTRTPLEQFNAQIAKLNKLSEDGAINWDTYARAVKQAQEEFSAADEEAAKMKDTARELGLTFSSAFEDAVIGGKKLKDVIRGLIADMARLVLRKAVTNPLANFLGDALKAGIGDLGSGLSTSLKTWAIIDGGGFGGARAAGGPVSANTAFLVGERGPELFTPSSNGQITPNSALGGNQYFIDARGADAGAVQRIERALMKLAGPGVTEQRAVSAVVSRASRGGSVGRVLRG